MCPWAAAHPPSTAHDLPGSVWSLCVPVGGGPPARSPHASLRLGVVDLEARPGPAATHRHHDQALRSLRRPPHLWGQVAVRQLYASSRSPARPRHRPRTPQPGHSPRTRPHKREKMRPARLHERNIAPAGHSTAWLTSSVKEISPLHAQNRQNTAFFSVQGRRTFHGTPQHLTQGRFFFHPSPSPTPQARKNSPCSAPPVPRRDKTLPARSKHPKIRGFSPAGRILSRFHPESRPAGRVLSRP